MCGIDLLIATRTGDIARTGDDPPMSRRACLTGIRRRVAFLLRDS